MRVLLAILLLHFSTWVVAADFLVESQPSDAEIFISTNANEKPMKIGNTPFKQDLNQLLDTYVKKQQFLITIKKKGHEDFNAIFTKTTNVDINLTVNLKVEDRISQLKDYDILMMKLFNVQKMIRGKNITDALAELTRLEEKYGDFSIVAELKATAYYINKDIENALTYYRKAFSLNSDNIDSYKMKVYLEKKMGVNSDL